MNSQSPSIMGTMILLFILFIANFFTHVVADDREVYVVYMGSKGNAAVESLLATQKSTLMDAFDSEEEAESSVIYSYKHAFSGFSARLTKAQANRIADMPGVVSVFKSRNLQLHTTASWQFLGLTSGNFKQMWEERSSDVIVGVLDTGIWPESESFRDHAMGPVPERWKGECEPHKSGKDAIMCNRKIIGARSYYDGRSSGNESAEDYTNARDSLGHGTHTASTIAGRVVKDASAYGLCQGNARGGLPKARLAIYKVCYFGDCPDYAVLAAFDDAVSDGVDIISASLGGLTVPYDEDTIAIGSFHAVRHGILVSCSAGNSGPFRSTVTNIAPWIMTVGASSTNRRLVSAVRLGNNELVEGAGLNIKHMARDTYGLVSGADAAIRGGDKDDARHCLTGSLDKSKVKDKIVVCHRSLGAGSRIGNSSAVVNSLGAAGLVQINELARDIAFSFALPSSILSFDEGERILSYIKSTRNATAVILPTKTSFDGEKTPLVAVFSSRGPSDSRLEVIKPDILAPGINILAAWTPDKPTIKNMKPPKGSTVFNIISGTSMSCPHASGAAAYVKSVHPNWTPAMIKSALMTTAISSYLKDYNGNAVTPYDYGAGQMDPLKASDPGLVYDISPSEYTDYLCALGYRSKKLRIVTGDPKVRCRDNFKPKDLNYPSITFLSFNGTAQSTTRTVTNVGADPNATYRVTVQAARGIDVRVIPETLEFSSQVKTRSYTVEVSSRRSSHAGFAFGSLVWRNGVHNVTSLIAVAGTDV